MLTFLTTVLLYVGVLLLCSLPAVVVAHRNPYFGRVGRKFLLAALACGLVCGLVVASSRQLTEQCRSEGNTQCHDSGAIGLVTLIILGFAGTSVVRAYLMATD